ncbi:MAG: RHS repeat-associated core domain-containing protein [Actinomycetota bacterium]
MPPAPAAEDYEFVYDVNGQRLIRRELATDGTTVTATLYLGMMEVTVNHDGTQTARRTYAAATGTVAVRDNDGVTWIGTGHLGSTRATINAATGTINQLRYLPFGNLRSGSTEPTDRLYTGQINDNNGLLYYNARYYDPTTRQFTQPDTIIPNPADGADWNRYTYVRNNPLLYTDPSGHCSVISGDLWCNGTNYGSGGTGDAAYHPEFTSEYFVSPFNRDPKLTGEHPYDASGGYNVWVRRSMNYEAAGLIGNFEFDPIRSWLDNDEAIADWASTVSVSAAFLELGFIGCSGLIVTLPKCGTGVLVSSFVATTASAVEALAGITSGDIPHTAFGLGGLATLGLGQLFKAIDPSLFDVPRQALHWMEVLITEWIPKAIKAEFDFWVGNAFE